MSKLAKIIKKLEINNSRIYLLYFLLIITTLSSYSQKQGKMLIDSLLGELPKSNNDTNKVNLFNSLSQHFYNISPENGLKFGNLGLKLAQRLNWKKGIANLEHKIAINYWANSSYLKAMEHNSLSLKVNKEIGNKSGIASNLGIMGLIYWSMGNFPKALEYYFKALKLNQVLGDKIKAASNLGNIGNVFNEQNDNEKALEYYFKALKINEAILNMNGMAINIANLGSIYNKQKDYNKALDYYSKAVKIFEQLGNKRSMAINMGNTGIVYLQLCDFKMAMEYYFNSLRINEEIGNKNGIGVELANIGELYLTLAKNTSLKIKPSRYFSNDKNENLNKAIKYLKESGEILSEVGDLNTLINNFKNLSETYQINSDNARAIDMLNKYSILKDSVFSRESRKKIADLEMKEEIELRDKQIQIQSLTLNNLKVQLISLFSGIILLAGILVFIFYTKRKKDKLLNIIDSNLDDALKYVFSLLPGPFTKGDILTTWRMYPCEKLGGDSFGYQWLDDNNLSIYFLDVSGHGVGSALLSSSILSDLNNRALNKADFYKPESVLNELNKSFQFEKHNNMFFSMWYCVYNKNNHELKYCGAGHPPILIFRKNNRLNRISSSNSFVGIESVIEFHEDSLGLEVGDILYFYSDGTYEVKLHDGSYYTIEKLTEYLRRNMNEDGSEIERLYNHLLNTKKMKLDDDFTMLKIIINV